AQARESHFVKYEVGDYEGIAGFAFGVNVDEHIASELNHGDESHQLAKVGDYYLACGMIQEPFRGRKTSSGCSVYREMTMLRIKEAAKNGSRVVWMRTHEDHISQIKFYESLGFRIVRTTNVAQSGNEN